MNVITESLIKTLKKFKRKKLSVHEPDVRPKDFSYLKNCIDKKEVSAIGSYTKTFEKKIAQITKAKNVILTNSGTSALHISCLLAGVKKNEEVLVPAFTFVASVNSILYSQGIPHFIDTKKNNLTIDFIKLDKYLKKISKKHKGRTINKKTNRTIKAIMIVHPFGHPVDCDQMIKISKKYNLEIIEDAADSLGSFFKKKHVGTFGKIGAISFNGNKIVTCGLGGAIITNNDKIAKEARNLISVSKTNHKFKFIHKKLGYNYRLANINAALGLSQLKRFENTLKLKRKLFKFYAKEINKNYFQLLKEYGDKKFNYWLQTIIIHKKYKSKVDKILNQLIKNGFNLRKGWELMTSINYLKKYPKMNLDSAKDIQSRIINLPSSSFLIKKN
jgi:perosamine synthetase